LARANTGNSEMTRAPLTTIYVILTIFSFGAAAMLAVHR